MCAGSLSTTTPVLRRCRPLNVGAGTAALRGPGWVATNSKRRAQARTQGTMHRAAAPPRRRATSMRARHHTQGVVYINTQSSNEATIAHRGRWRDLLASRCAAPPPRLSTSSQQPVRDRRGRVILPSGRSGLASTRTPRRTQCRWSQDGFRCHAPGEAGSSAGVILASPDLSCSVVCWVLG